MYSTAFMPTNFKKLGLIWYISSIFEPSKKPRPRRKVRVVVVASKVLPGAGAAPK
jgi:hypothetical protein